MYVCMYVYMNACMHSATLKTLSVDSGTPKLITLVALSAVLVVVQAKSITLVALPAVLVVVQAKSITLVALPAVLVVVETVTRSSLIHLRVNFLRAKNRPI